MDVRRNPQVRLVATALITWGGIFFAALVLGAVLRFLWDTHVQVPLLVIVAAVALDVWLAFLRWRDRRAPQQ